MNQGNLLYISGLIVISFLLIIQGCLSDEISTDPSFSVEFSQDTLRFDTVFTTIGSATRSLRIYNNNDQDIAISSIRLDNGDQTMFRLNVDGLAGQAFADIRLPANDSIWVFAEVTIDPDAPLSVSPFILEDKMLVTVNGNEEFVQLEAFGQNANYLSIVSNIGTGLVIPCRDWNDSKPYIIYGIIEIADCTINIAPGTRIHVHGGLVDDGGFRNDGIIVVGNNGSIQAQGTLDDPIIFQGDRLEENFRDVPGQWGGIIQASGSRRSNFDYVEIKNSIVGLRADSATDVRIQNSKIYNTAGTGIQGQFASVEVSNTLIHSNNLNCFRADFGGTYNFDHCTMANYLNSDPALGLTNVKCREVDEAGNCTLFDVRPLHATFNNCVIAGNDRDEVALLDATEDDPGFFDLTFDHSAVQMDEILDLPRWSNLLIDDCNNCFVINRGDTLFRDEFGLNFHPDTLSTLINRALYNPQLPLDLDGIERATGSTDIGCYEFVPGM